jgi:hypothetical protein
MAKGARAHTQAHARGATTTTQHPIPPLCPLGCHQAQEQPQLHQHNPSNRWRPLNRGLHGCAVETRDLRRCSRTLEHVMLSVTITCAAWMPRPHLSASSTPRAACSVLP